MTKDPHPVGNQVRYRGEVGILVDWQRHPAYPNSTKSMTILLKGSGDRPQRQIVVTGADCIEVEFLDRD